MWDSCFQLFRVKKEISREIKMSGTEPLNSSLFVFLSCIIAWVFSHLNYPLAYKSPFVFPDGWKFAGQNWSLNKDGKSVVQAISTRQHIQKYVQSQQSGQKQSQLKEFEKVPSVWLPKLYKLLVYWKQYHSYYLKSVSFSVWIFWSCHIVTVSGPFVAPCLLLVEISPFSS